MRSLRHEQTLNNFAIKRFTSKQLRGILDREEVAKVTGVAMALVCRCDRT